MRDTSFPAEETVKILLAEYTGLRSEIIAKTGHGLQVAGFVVTASSFLVSQTQNWLTVYIVTLIVLLVAGAGMLIFNDVARASKRIRQIEVDVNNRAGEELLVWETGWGWGKEPPGAATPRKANN